MPKKSKKQMKEDEKKIINYLKKDSRTSINEMAEKLGFSRQKVWRIIKNLEKDKKIWGYTAIIDDDTFNIKRYIILIKKAMVSGDAWVDKITSLTMQKKSIDIGVDVEYSMFLNGEYDWMFILTANNLKDVKRFSEVLTKEYHGIIKDVNILEDVFPVEKGGIINPNVEKLKEFFQ